MKIFCQKILIKLISNYAVTYWKELYNKRSEDNLELAFEDELLDFKNKFAHHTLFGAVYLLLD